MIVMFCKDETKDFGVLEDHGSAPAVIERLGVWGHGDQGNTVDVSAWEHEKNLRALDSKHFLALGDECRMQLRDVTTWPVATSVPTD